MRALPLLLLLALPLAACSDNADEPTDRREATANAAPLEPSPEGGVIDQRGQAVTVRGLEPGDRWCRISYDTPDGDAGTANGYLGLCEQADKVGQQVTLGLTTFEAPAGCTEEADGCVDGRLEVVNVFLPADLEAEDATP